MFDTTEDRRQSAGASTAATKQQDLYTGRWTKRVHSKSLETNNDPFWFVQVFTHFSGEGYKCIRIPSLVTALDGTLIAISEGRHWTGDGCNPNSSVFNQSDSRTDLVFKRSTDCE